MKRRVMITGLGCITAAGLTLEATWQAIMRGQSGLSVFDADARYPLVGAIQAIDLKTLLSDRKLLKLISRQDVFGLNAVSSALQDSGLIEHRNLSEFPEDFNCRTGVYVGAPGSKYQQQDDFMPLMHKAKNNMHQFAELLFETVHPMWLLRILPNNVLAYTGILHGFKGANENITNHVVSGLQAILEAAYAIEDGRIDRAVVVSYDHATEPQGIAHFSQLGLLSQSGIKSFDVAHAGTVLAEGAGALILEAYDDAKARGATCYAEVLSGGTQCQAQGIFNGDRDGIGLQRSIEKTLSSADLPSNSVGMISSHGNGVPQSDISESKAISTIVGATTPVTGWKWALGHTLSGSGVIETVLTARALQERCAPGIATHQSLNPMCAPISVSADHQRLEKDTALVIARAFGGMTTTVLLQRGEHDL